MKKPVAQLALAFALLGAGIVWSIMFPKKMTLDGDMVLSTGFGIGLVGSGLLVLWGNRRRLPIVTLSTLLLWSLVANAYLFAWQYQVADVHMKFMIEQSNRPMQTDAASPRR